MVAVATDETYVNGDQAYGYDPAKWVAFANSLRMRYAMRLSEVDPAKAQSEFEAAVAAGSRITPADLTWKRPAHGISPRNYDEVLTMRVRRDIPEDTVLRWSDLDDGEARG